MQGRRVEQAAPLPGLRPESLRGVAFCAACSRFPCKSMAALEKTYQKRWGISLAETGRRAAAGEAEALLAGQRRRWLCACGVVISLHDGVCSECGRPVD